MDEPGEAFKALAYAIQNEPKLAREVLAEMSTEDLDQLVDGLDVLATLADEQAIKRAERRS